MYIELCNTYVHSYIYNTLQCSITELSMVSLNVLYVGFLSKGVTIVSPTICRGITKGDDLESLFPTKEGMQLCT